MKYFKKLIVPSANCQDARDEAAHENGEDKGFNACHGMATG